MHFARTAALGTATFALAAMTVVGTVANHSEPASPTPVVASDAVELVALPSLSFEAGVYIENRISDHVEVPPGVVFAFQGLPPGLTFDPATTAISGVPTTPGVYHPVATAYIAGVPVRTESTTVTITGNAVAPAPAPANPAPPVSVPPPAPQGVPAPGIDLALIQTLPLPAEVKLGLLLMVNSINDGIAAAWATIPTGSVTGS